MLSKVLHLDPYFPTGELTVQPVVLWANGRPCVEDVTKYASVGDEYFRTIQPIPGHSIVYVLAVSGWETYGENRNGDGFPEYPFKEDATPPWIAADDVLPLHYKTFEQYGYNYRHHCFPAGSLVLLANRKRVAIEDVQKNDLVETLSGPRKVTKIMRRPYAGEGVQLSLRGNYQPLTGTADHPVLVYQREQVHCPHGYCYLTLEGRGCSTKACQEKRGSIGEPVWVPLSAVLPGDYLVFPKPKHGNTVVDPGFARLVGWVASEGHLGKRGSIQFTFSSKNTLDIPAVKKCLEENNLHVGLHSRSDGLTMASSCSSRVHAALSDYVQGVFSEKSLTEKILEWDSESLLQMLGTYIDGDGHVCPTGKNAGQLRIRSSSPQMLNILSDIIKSLGIPATVQWDIPAGEMISPTNGKQYSYSGSGVVAVAAAYSPQITKYSRKKCVWETRTPQTLAVGDTFLVRVTDREDIVLEEEVFNLEVEELHHYVVNDVVVHNCNKDPKKAVGKVMKAFWNPTMHRVELLVDLDNTKAPDLAERIEAGEFPPVSMGTRVKYDVCSECGNRAPTRAQYCDHLKFQMKQTLPSGRTVCALNPKPKFFDISWVFKPADPMAYMMKKVAEAPYEISGASAGEYIDKMAERKLAARKLAVIDKIVQGYPVDAKTEGFDEADIHNIQGMRDIVLSSAQSTPELPDDVLRRLSAHPINKVMSTLFAGGMSLSTPEVVKIVIYKSYPKATVGDDVLDKCVVMQRPIMDFLGDCPQVMDQIEKTGAFDISPENIDVKIAQEVDDYFEKRSGIGQYLKRRLVPAQWRETPEPRTSPLTVTDPATGTVYGTTRGAALEAHDEIAKRNLMKVLGGGALLAGGYKVLGSGLERLGHGKLKPLLALSLGTLGATQWPKMGPHYMTDQGVPIPTLTEMVPKQAGLRETVGRKASSLALPMLGTLAAMSALGLDYQSRLRRGEPVGHPALPLSRRILDRMGRFSYEHPLITAAAGTAALKGLGRVPAVQKGMGYAGRAGQFVKEKGRKAADKLKDAMRGLAEDQVKMSELLEPDLPTPAGTVELPEVDMDKIATKVGLLIWEG